MRALKVTTLAIAFALTAAPALAQEIMIDLPLIPEPATIVASAEAQPSKAVQSDEELAALSGGADTNTAIALTEQDLTAVNSGNQINATTVGSGAITLSDSALSGFAGVGNIVMNTGHNNNLQSSLSVTIIVTD